MTESPRKKLRCSKKTVEGPWDVIVIGSGMSGMCVAAELSRKGSRVLVLEKHYQPGGFTHVFRRNVFEWDVGIHYVGNAEPGTEKGADWFMQLSALTGGNISFRKIREPVDRIIFPDLQVEMPSTFEAYLDELSKYFPGEKDNINRYFKDIKETRAGLRNYFATGLLPKPIKKILRGTFFKKTDKAALSTTEEVMSRYISDERLKDVLDAQWGNIGMPRKKCSFLIHAAMLGCFLENGAYYPEGGSSIFARELGDTIYKNGSVIRVSAAVEKIIVKNGKAVGVKLENGEEITAGKVVSSAGVRNTYNKFLADCEEVSSERTEINSVPLNYQYMNLFMGFDTSPDKFGLNDENYWIYKKWGTEPENGFWDVRGAEKGDQPHVMFLNSSSMRDPLHGKFGNSGHVGQVVFIGKQGMFEKWKDKKWQKRGSGYEELKEKAGEMVINSLDRYLPGLKSHVSEYNVSTPLSYETFSFHPQGVPYGLASIPDRYRLNVLKPQTPVKNLYLTGQDMILPGIPAAVGSAMMTLSIMRKENVGGRLIKEASKMYRLKA